jgi:hypothetical protein
MSHLMTPLCCCKQQTQAALSEVYAPNPDTTAIRITSPTVTACVISGGWGTLRCPSEG